MPKRSHSAELVVKTKTERSRLRNAADSDSALAFAEFSSMLDQSLNFAKRVISELEDTSVAKSKGLTSNGVQKENLDLSLFTGGTLRDYQLEGVSWLVNLRRKMLNGILADEMGLGKSAQSVAAICHFIASGSKGPFLVLAPLSTIRNWENEFHRFAPEIPTVVLHETKEARQDLIGEITAKKQIPQIGQVFPVVITPYHTLVSEIQILQKFRWSFLVIDEASVIKNHKTRINRSCSALMAQGKLLLTGTPLQNDIHELFNLMHFVLPKVFHDYRLFKAWLEELDSKHEKGSLGDTDSLTLVNSMHKILTPFFLRRTKASIKLALPAKKQVIVYCPMSQLQRNYYECVLDRSLAHFAKGSSKDQEADLYEEDGRRRKRKSSVLALHQITQMSTPQMKRARTRTQSTPARDEFDAPSEKIVASEDDSSNAASESTSVETSSTIDFDDLLRKRHLRLTMNSVLAMLRKIAAHPWLVSCDLENGYYPSDKKELLEVSGKMQIFDKLVTELLQRGHKVLVFSPFVIVLELVSLYLELSDIPHFFLSGNTKLEDRQDHIDEFNRPDSPEKVFLISTRAGGMGINLTGADTVIFFDSDWNPQMDLQASDRCHRIGQTRPVVVYRLVAKGTIDERILGVAGDKRRLEKLIIDCGHFEKVTSSKEINQLELLQALKAVDWDKAVEDDLLHPETIKRLADREFVMRDGEHETATE